MTARIPFARVLPGALCLVAAACGSSGSHSTSAGTRTAPVPATHPVNGTILDAASGRAVGVVSANGMISAATADGHGGWYLAGAFTRVDGRPRAHLAHVSAGGALDPVWRPPALGPAGTIQFLSIADTGTLVLVAGGFRTVGGARSTGTVALDPTTGAVDPAWHTPPVCADGNWAVRAAPGGVYLATACAAPPCLVALRPHTGGVQTNWGAGIQAVGEEGCIGDMTLANGAVIFTGGFTAVGGQARNGIAAVSQATAHLIPGFVPHGACAGDSHAVSASGGLVFVGGDGCPAAAFARATGAPVWSWPRRGNATTAALAAAGPRLYVGGAFAQLAGAPANGLAALDQRTGSAVATWHPARPASIEALSVSGPRLLIGAG